MAMLRYPRMQNIMRTTPKPMGMAAPAQAIPRVPMMPKTNMAPAFKPPTFKAAPSTLPSIQTTLNQATPIELGDPQRLGKIATLLRMGRR